MKIHFNAALSGLKQFLVTESPLKTMKPLSPFVLNIFKFLSWLLIVQKDGLIRKARLISKFLPSQPGKQTIVIHILLNISKSRSLAQLNLVSWKNISWETFFLKNHIQYVVENPFLLRISSYSVRMRENTNQNNSEYGHFLRSVFCVYSCW